MAIAKRDARTLVAASVAMFLTNDSEDGEGALTWRDDEAHRAMKAWV